MLRMMQTTWSWELKIRPVYAFIHRANNRRLLAYFAKLLPQMLAHCLNAVAEDENIGAIMHEKKAVPTTMHRTLGPMQLATQDVPNTDCHRWPLRHENNAYAMRFGACVMFTTPNSRQQRNATFLFARTECEEPVFSLEMQHPDLGTLGGTMKKQADHPVSLALAGDLVFRLFHMHVFGAGPNTQASQERHLG